DRALLADAARRPGDEDHSILESHLASPLSCAFSAMVTSLLTSMLIAAAPLPTVVSADNVVWIELPSVPQTLGRLEGTPLAPFAALIGTKTERSSLKSASPGAMIAALFRGSAGKVSESASYVDAGPAADAAAAALIEALLNQGYAKAGSASAPPLALT